MKTGDSSRFEPETLYLNLSRATKSIPGLYSDDIMETGDRVGNDAKPYLDSKQSK